MKFSKFSPAMLAVLSVCMMFFYSWPLHAEIPNTGPAEGFVETNGVRLQYLDWGGTGPALILIHGLGDNAYAFDDFAPAFTDRYHVIAYARRGSGSSDVKGPYDLVTLTEDLRGLMDALRIQKANLVGWSAGGDEITSFAADYPDRVNRIIYLDAVYDFTDPDFHAAVDALPLGFFRWPADAMSSPQAYLAYSRAFSYPEFDGSDMKRIEANLLAKVVVQSNGTLKERTPKSVIDALYAAIYKNEQRQYSKVHCPALAFVADSLYDLNIADPKRRDAVVAFEEHYWRPFQAKSLGHAEREFSNLKVVKINGAHGNFIFTHRDEVVEVMQRFLEDHSTSTARREP